MKFENKVAVITGAGSGIGKETALLLAREGAEIILVGRTQSKLEKAAKEINEVCDNNTAVTFAADITKEEEVRGLSDFLKSEYGSIDVLINNFRCSGSTIIFVLVLDDWEVILTIFVTGVCYIYDYII